MSVCLEDKLNSFQWRLRRLEYTKTRLKTSPMIRKLFNKVKKNRYFVHTMCYGDYYVERHATSLKKKLISFDSNFNL